MIDRHLEPERISSIAAGRLEGADRTEALAHLDACDTCRADLTYVLGFDRRRRRRRAAFLAAGVAAALFVVFLPRAALTPPDSLRGPGDEGVARITSHAPPNGARLDARQIEFAWADMGPDASYRLHVATVDGGPLLERALGDTAVALDLADDVKRGERYLWFVDALLGDGSQARSEVWSFTMAR